MGGTEAAPNHEINREIIQYLTALYKMRIL